MRKVIFVSIGVAGVCVAAAALIGWRVSQERWVEAVVKEAVPAVPDLSAWPHGSAAQVRAATAVASRFEQPVAALTELAGLYHANGCYREAAQVERGLLTFEPKNGRWTYLMADASEKLNDPEAQRSLLEATLRLAPYYATTRIKLAELLLKMGLPDEARAQYEWRLTLVPGDPYARLGLARIASQAGDRVAAVKYLEAIVAEHPVFPAARNLLSQIYGEMGDATRAEEQRRLSGATGEWRDPEDPWMDGVYTWGFDPYHFNKIDGTPLQARRLDASLAFYTRAVRKSPDDGRLYDAIGQIDLQLGRLDAAAATLESGLAAAPATAALYSTLSRVRSLQGQGPASIAVLRRGVAAAPGAPGLRCDLGSVLEAGGSRDEAVAEYREAVRLDPRFAEAHWSLGLCLLAMARDSEAKASLGRAVELKPARGGDLATLAQGAIDAGRFARAGCCIHVLVESCPGSPVRQLLERAAAAARKGGDARAAADFEELLARSVR